MKTLIPQTIHWLQAEDVCIVSSVLHASKDKN